MSIFSGKADSKRTSSLEAFKAKADGASATVSVERITGGTLADCHRPAL